MRAAMMDQAGVLSAALERIRTSPRIADDFAALCACGGRFAGTPSEARVKSGETAVNAPPMMPPWLLPL